MDLLVVFRERPKGPLAGWLGSFGRNLSALSAAAQAFRYLFRSLLPLMVSTASKQNPRPHQTVKF